jgi:hypothetical protein
MDLREFINEIEALAGYMDSGGEPAIVATRAANLIRGKALSLVDRILEPDALVPAKVLDDHVRGLVGTLLPAPKADPVFQRALLRAVTTIKSLSRLQVEPTRSAVQKIHLGEEADKLKRLVVRLKARNPHVLSDAPPGAQLSEAMTPIEMLRRMGISCGPRAKQKHMATLDGVGLHSAPNTKRKYRLNLTNLQVQHPAYYKHFTTSHPTPRRSRGGPT